MMLRFSVRTSFSCAPFPVRQNAVPPKLDLKCSYNSTDDYQTCLSLFFPHKLDSILCSFLSLVIFFHYFQKQKKFLRVSLPPLPHTFVEKDTERANAIVFAPHEPRKLGQLCRCCCCCLFCTADAAASAAAAAAAGRR